MISSESTHLLRGSDPAASVTGRGIDGSTAAMLREEDTTYTLYATSGHSGGYYCGIADDHRHVVNNLPPTPLDPLLKDLKREYASFAGPQDILASMISTRELEMLLSETMAMAVKTPATTGAGPSENNQLPGVITITEMSRSSMPGGEDDAVDQAGSSVVRSSTPLASGSGAVGTASRQHHHSLRASTMSTTVEPLGSPLLRSSTPHHAQQQQQKHRRRMRPDFCHSPASHVDNLLRTTPHLRHLSLASTDMSGSGVYDASKNIFAQLLNFNKGKKSSAGVDNGGGSAGIINDSNSSTSSPSGGGGPGAIILDYHTTLLRERANRRASLELATFMRLLSNEMPTEQFSMVETEVYSKVFSLVHSKTIRADDRRAGVAALDALLSVPSADEERRAIRFGNNLSNGLKKTTSHSSRSADYEFLHAIARALGRMALGASNVDRVEFEIGRSLEWLRSDRSDRRLAAVLVLRELAKFAPTAFYSKTQHGGVNADIAEKWLKGGGGGGGDGGRSGIAATNHLAAGVAAASHHQNDFLDHIWPALRDPQPIVRACAADALSECLAILMERQPRSMTAPLCTLFDQMMAGLSYYGAVGADQQQQQQQQLHGLRGGGEINATTHDAMTLAVNAHGSLLVVAEMLKHSKDFILPRFDEVCVAVLKFTNHPLILIRLEVIRLIPKLAKRCQEVFGRRDYLRQSLQFLISSAGAKGGGRGTKTSSTTRCRIDVKSSAFMSIGQLALAMSDEEMGGGDLTIPSVRIVRNDKVDEDKSNEEEDDFEYHIVELKDESDFQERLVEIFDLCHKGAGSSSSVISRCDVLGFFANFVEALGTHASPYVMEIVENMFESVGLSEDLIKCLHSIGRSLPSRQLAIESKVFEEISSCLAGRTIDVFSPIKSKYGHHQHQRPKMKSEASSLISVVDNDSSSSVQHQPTLERNFMSSMSLSSMNPSHRPIKKPTPQSVEQLDVQQQQHEEAPTPAKSKGEPVSSSAHKTNNSIVINTSTKPAAVHQLILSLQTLRTIGESYMRGAAFDSGDGNLLLPFLRNVISAYFSHHSSDVRREAAVTCCRLLLPFGTAPVADTPLQQQSSALLRSKPDNFVSGTHVEEILEKLLRMAVSDASPLVRLCIVRGFDERYDALLSLPNHLAPLFLLLQDEAFAVRAMALRKLGRLSRINPAPILPGLRHVLLDLIIELQCGGGVPGNNKNNSGGKREAATRLLVVFLREKEALLQSLTRPFISSIIDALPLDNIAPRLALTSLEALGELSGVAAQGTVEPWLRQLLSHILSNIQDQNSSKQRTSLWALGKIAYGTAYVVQPYLDYPNILTCASDILPTTKNASWELRREVFRTFGILGALDSDRFGSGSTAWTRRKGGGKGGGYFVELEGEAPQEPRCDGHSNSKQTQESSGGTSSQSLSPKNIKDSDNDNPVHLYMYEQYAMTAQPLSQLSPAKRLSPIDEAFFPTVAVQALMRILKDPTLSNLHGMVMKAVMFIFNALGLKSVPFLKNIVPHILVTVKNCGQHGLREALLQQVANLSAIVREHLRPYLPAIFDVVSTFWSSQHLSALCSLVERVAAAVPEDFRAYVPMLVRQALGSIEEIDITEWNGTNSSVARDIERLDLILIHIQGIKGVMGEYIHLVVPALVKLTGELINPSPDDKEMTLQPSGTRRSSLAVHTVETLSILLQTNEVNSNLLIDTSVKSNSALPTRVVQPFLRMLNGNVTPNKEVGHAIIGCICICVRQLGAGRWLSFYNETTREAITTWQSKVGLERSQDEPQGLSEMIENEQPLIDLYEGVVDEISSNSNMWIGGSVTDEDVSYSLGRSGTSDVSLTMMGETLKGNDTPSIPQPTPSATPHAHRANLGNLQKAWDVSQRSTREDWDEWMRRFSVQLLREASSPALRACAELAQAYQPLARELFSAAFVCCWGELTDQYRSNLQLSLEVVFSADASLEILQLLLNLAEFMEHEYDAKIPRLSIDISILAELALKCRAYARALHYKEREYIMGRGGSCVEQLIDINKKLDLPEAALGVLRAAKIEIQRRGGQSLVSSHNQADSRSGGIYLNEYSVIASYGDSEAGGDHSSWAGDIVIYESWLAKLGAWAESLSLYEEKLRGNPHDVTSILGCLQCYDARGEWQKALDLAGRSWPALLGNDFIESDSRWPRKKSSGDSYYKQALKFCAQSAWRLGKWDELETYSFQLLEGQHGSYNAQPHMSAEGISSSKESRPTNAPKLDFSGAFYRAVVHIHRTEWDQAAKCIDSARKAMDSRFTALLAESYKRAYPSMVSAQSLSELEEIISFRQSEMRGKGMKVHEARTDISKARQHLLKVWRKRLHGCRSDSDVYSEILAVRSLVLGPTDEVDATITLSTLSRQAEAYQLAERTLLQPLERMGCSLNSPRFGVGLPSNLGLGLTMNPGETMDSIVTGEKSVLINYRLHHEQFSKQLFTEAGGEERLFIQHKLYFAYIKHLWATERKDEAMTRLGLLCKVVDLTTTQGEHEKVESEALRVSCWLRYGDWKIAMCPPGTMLTDSLSTEVLLSYKRAADATGSNYRSSHAWALINFRLAEQIRGNDKDKGNSIIRGHVIAAVKGFVRAISVGTKRWSASVQQDLLNLLSCLFKYAGEVQDVASTISEGMNQIEIDAWLGVLPQLLARIHIKTPAVRSILHPLLVRLGAKHPQALMIPLSVLLKSPVADRKAAAEELMNSLKAHSNALVEEALMVSSELIRVAILWLELWHESLEDASRLYYGEGNVSGMLDVLLPLHTQLEKGASTRKELEFLKSFGRDLMDAHKHIKEYVRLITASGQQVPTQGGFLSPNEIQAGQSGPPANAEAEAALNQAWDLYYTVFRRINKQLPSLTTLELNECSPALYNARNLELGVPGSYRVDGSYVKIHQFIADVQVITSKQRPRKITVRGQDGRDYVFLLKGHEDLRQDERVMQLFGLVNALLARDRRTNKHDLNIQRYAIAPLSHNAGVVGWVPHCDTLHCLIRDYRETLKMPLNAENREMMALTPNYDMLTVMQKVEVFTEALERTKGKGNDLYEVLWIKSTNSEEWLERRTNFTRSLAVMSMVGYILGLGDRHPSNLMLDQVSGRVLHIDFGDCFEVAMHREKFPEKVPFRLTRMLTRAMEVSGIEGSYRSTCERTMAVLRDNKDSLLAMLEAFVYDPLISWRLLDQSPGDVAEEAETGATTKEEQDNETSTAVEQDVDNSAIAHTILTLPIQEEQDEDGGDCDDENEVNDEDVIEKEDDVNDSSGSSSVDNSVGSQKAGASSLGALKPAVKPTSSAAAPSAHAKSLKMYNEMRALAANLSTSSRIASITGGAVDTTFEQGSAARSRIDKSVRQRELLSMIDGDAAAANEEALNERALKVIRRVQDKLTGTDFHTPDEEAGEPSDVQDQVQRLIVQATSSENLCQLFIGWCAFW